MAKAEKNYAVSQEIAEKDFLNWCEANDIEVEEISDDEKANFEKQKKFLIKACREGRLVFDGQNIEYTISKFSPEYCVGQKITIKPPTGRSLMATDGMKESQIFKKVFAQLSNMTGRDVGFFAEISMKDLNVFQAALVFFFAS